MAKIKFRLKLISFFFLSSLILRVLRLDIKYQLKYRQYNKKMNLRFAKKP